MTSRAKRRMERARAAERTARSKKPPAPGQRPAQTDEERAAAEAAFDALMNAKQDTR